MSFQLKEYQEKCIDELRAYLRRAKQFDGKVAFIERTGRPYQSVEQLPGLPYVCIRVPTGGGKTLLAAHSVGLATSEFLMAERSVVLWLAPSNAIVGQTLRALKDRQHPYRQALDQGCPGGVTVLDVKEALYTQRSVLDSETTVIVSTLQAFRVDDTDGRKVYETNGALQHHFSGLTARDTERLEGNKDGNGVIPYSLANVLRLRRPIIIVDEAHNVRTELSFDTLSRFNPSCIIEYTATPDQEKNPSNILCHVSAAELKAEEMIKLPIRLTSVSNWKEAVQGAVAKQSALERLARENEKSTGEYLRPILLFQAQPKSSHGEPVTAEVLAKYLVKEHEIPKDQVVIHTGTKKGLDGINILDRDCAIRFVITVQALKEGWDCPFAYILCTVQNLSATTAVEQILGRVLRMPYARRKDNEQLNYAYAFATSQGFAEAAKGLVDALIESGFEKFEAQTCIQQELALPPGVLFESKPSEPVTEVPNLDSLPEVTREKLRFDSDKQSIIAETKLSEEETVLVEKCFEKPENKLAARRLGRRSQNKDASPAALGERFEVPVLALAQDGQLEIFEDQFREVPWELAECPPTLSKKEYNSEIATQVKADVDITKEGKITVDQEFVKNLHEQMQLLDYKGPQSESELAAWLDRVIKHPDIIQSNATMYFHKMIMSLEESRELLLEDLVRDRFRLRDAAEAKIEGCRQEAFTASYQRTLGIIDGDNDDLRVDPKLCFSFPRDSYPAHSYYTGPIQLKKHYYLEIGDMNTEEVPCASIIANLESVEYWVRNIERSQYSFRLPTSTDFFYPDFVARLKDGRFLAVEYKGAHLMDSPDSKEKQAVGEIWEAQSNGKCIFRWVGKDDIESLHSDPALISNS